MSIWFDANGAPTMPATAIRSAIEAAAGKVKQGPQVREGLVIDAVQAFDYDHGSLGSTIEEPGRSAQFTVPVVVHRNRIECTRARFDTSSVTFAAEAQNHLVDQSQLQSWLPIAALA